MLNKFIMILCFAGIISYSPAQDTTRGRTGTQNQDGNNTRTQTEEENNTQTRNNTQTQEFNAFNSVCPVDGQEIDPGIETIRHNGKDYGFDSPSCALVFSEDPEIYAGQLSDDGADFTRRELEPEERDQLGTETNGTGTGQRDQMGTEDQIQSQGQDQIGTQDQNQGQDQTGNQDQNQTQEDQMGTTGQDTTQQRDQMGTEDQIQSQGQDQIGTETQPADTTDQFGTEPIDTTDQFGTEPTDTTDQFGTEEEENGTQDQIE